MEEALISVAEEILLEHQLIPNQEPTTDMRDLGCTNKDGDITPTDKVVPFGEFYDLQNQCLSKNFSLDFMFLG